MRIRSWTEPWVHRIPSKTVKELREEMLTHISVSDSLTKPQDRISICTVATGLLGYIVGNVNIQHDCDLSNLINYAELFSFLLRGEVQCGSVYRPVVSGHWVLGVGERVKKKWCNVDRMANQHLALNGFGTGKWNWKRVSMPNSVNVRGEFTIWSMLYEILSFLFPSNSICDLKQLGFGLIRPRFLLLDIISLV